MAGFDEKGSSAALSTQSQRYEVGELGAGLRLAGNLPLGGYTPARERKHLSPVGNPVKCRRTGNMPPFRDE
ncbi:MAG: hypothetical protein WBB95_10650 [Pseudomonas sp.]|uniref:hypothetical protein n=1 Tax=Pseudomonas sp. TaxID=306 RepID=UPI003C770D5F